MEEFSIAKQLWRFSAVDLCEMARNSLLQSGFADDVKARWLGTADFVNRNEPALTNVPSIRHEYRQRLLRGELAMVRCGTQEDHNSLSELLFMPPTSPQAASDTNKAVIASPHMSLIEFSPTDEVKEPGCLEDDNMAAADLRSAKNGSIHGGFSGSSNGLRAEASQQLPERLRRKKAAADEEEIRELRAKLAEKEAAIDASRKALEQAEADHAKVSVEAAAEATPPAVDSSAPFAKMHAMLAFVAQKGLDMEFEAQWQQRHRVEETRAAGGGGERGRSRPGEGERGRSRSRSRVADALADLAVDDVVLQELRGIEDQAARKKRAEQIVEEAEAKRRKSRQAAPVDDPMGPPNGSV